MITEAYVLIFNMNEIENILKNNQEELVKFLFKRILPDGSKLPSIEKIISLYEDFDLTDKKCFSYVFYPDSQELLYTTQILFTKKDQNKYQKNARWGYEFYLYKHLSRKEKLKDI